MAIQFKVIAKHNPLDKAAPEKYYARAVNTSKIDLLTLAKNISRGTTMARSDVIGVLYALEDEIVANLCNGASVELGRVCTFSPSLKSVGSDTMNDFNAKDCVVKRNITIRPKKSLLAELRDVALTRRN